MGVIGDVLPIAIGVAISVMPIVAAVVLMSSVGGTIKAWAFSAGYFVAVLALTLFIVLQGQQADSASDDGSGSNLRSVIQLLLGAGLLFLSYRNFRNRNVATSDDSGPAWLKTVDKVSVPAACGLGAAAGGANPKNLALIPGAAATIVGAGLTTAGLVSTSIIFALIGTCGVAIPLFIPLFAGEKKDEVLTSVRQWLTHNSPIIMMVLLFVLGWNLIGKGLSGLGT